MVNVGVWAKLLEAEKKTTLLPPLDATISRAASARLPPKKKTAALAATAAAHVLKRPENID